MEQRIMELEAIVENQSIEIGHMGHALDMQAEQYGVQGNLLYELSKNQRENEMLRNDLLQKEEVIHNMAHDIDSFQHSVNELASLRQSLEAELMQKTEECDVLREEFDVLKSENEDMKSEREELLNIVEERTKALEELNTTFEEVAHEKENLERENEQLASDKSSQVQGLERELDALRQKSDNMQTVTDYAEEQLHISTEKCKALERQLRDLKENKITMSQEMTKLQSQLDFFVQQKLSNEKQRNEISKINDTLEKQVKSLTEQLEEAKRDMEEAAASRSKSETEMRDKVSESLEELRRVCEARDTLQKKSNEWQDAHQEMESKARDLEQKLTEAEEKVQNMEQSKSMIQKTLLGQITSLRDKVTRQESECEQHREQMNALEKEVSRLRILVDATKKARESLSNSQAMAMPHQQWSRYVGDDEMEDRLEFDSTNSSTVTSDFGDTLRGTHTWSGSTFREQLASLSAMSPSLLTRTGSLSRTIQPARRKILADDEHNRLSFDPRELDSSSHSNSDLYDTENEEEDGEFHNSGGQDESREVTNGHTTENESEDDNENENGGLIQREILRRSNIWKRQKDNSFQEDPNYEQEVADMSFDYRRTMSRPSNPEPFQQSANNTSHCRTPSNSRNSAYDTDCSYTSNSDSDVSRNNISVRQASQYRRDDGQPLSLFELAGISENE